MGSGLKVIVVELTDTERQALKRTVSGGRFPVPKDRGARDEDAIRRDDAIAYHLRIDSDPDASAAEKVDALVAAMEAVLSPKGQEASLPVQTTRPSGPSFVA